MAIDTTSTSSTRSRRLSKAERRRVLLDAALTIVRDEGADRLTLGYLAQRSGVSKPVAYEHFGTRSGLLIALYRWIDNERVEAFRQAMASSQRNREETVRKLAKAYIECAADLTGEFHVIGAALAGSDEKAKVYQELLDASVLMFVSVLEPFEPAGALKFRCIGLVGAGEALSSAIIRGEITGLQAIETFASLIDGALE